MIHNNYIVEMKLIIAFFLCEKNHNIVFEIEYNEEWEEWKIILTLTVNNDDLWLMGKR